MRTSTLLSQLHMSYRQLDYLLSQVLEAQGSGRPREIDDKLAERIRRYDRLCLARNKMNTLADRWNLADRLDSDEIDELLTILMVPA